MFRGNLLFFISCVAVVTTFECGKRVEPTRHKRIINGYNAGYWPWMAHIKTEKYNDGYPYYCGGSVIGSRWVLTARHCLKGVDNVNTIRVIFGETHVQDIDKDKSKVRRNATSFLLYDDLYKTEDIWRAMHLHDIALIELDQPLDFNEQVQPICLPSRIDPIYEKGAELITIGHGDKSPSTSMAQVADDNILREMKFIADHPAQCKARLQKELEREISLAGILSDWFRVRFDPKYSIDEEVRLNICAKKNDRGAVTCFGDSGSPVMLQNGNKRWFEFGLTTHKTLSETCDQPGVVNLFANIVEHCEFIAKATKGEVTCIDVKA